MSCYTLKFVLEKRFFFACALRVTCNFEKYLHTQTGERFDEKILNYIRSNPSFHKTTVNPTDWKLDNKVKESFDNFFDRRNLENISKKSLPDSIIRNLPYYILELGRERKLTGDNNILGILSVCDFHCSKIPLTKFSDRKGRFTSLKILDSWMHILDHYYLVSDLECYPNLIKESLREMLSSSFSVSSRTLSESTPEIIHLGFVASLGKKKLVESVEVVSQLAYLCREYPECTYKTWSDFELAVMCSSFFRSGIKIESSELLREISGRVSEILDAYLMGEVGLDVSIVISLLKVLRQANFIEERVLSGVGKLIMDKDKGEDPLRRLTVLSHLMSAFSSSPVRRMTLDPGLVRVLERAEHLVHTALRTEQQEVRVSSGHSRLTNAVQPSVKSRLKDISRWLWSAALLGYHQINTQTYDEDFTRRFSTGEFTEQAPAALQALLALAVMNHYPQLILNTVLHSLHFRSALKVRCHRVEKVRFALFLTLVKIERNDLWRQLSPHDISQLQAIAPRSSLWKESQEWKSKLFDTKREKCAQHCEMLNRCMESLNRIYGVGDEEPGFLGNKHKNFIVAGSNELVKTKVEIRRGCAVPYLFIPGIRIDFFDSGRSVFLEVVDTESFSPGFLQMKLRILSQLGHAVLYITPSEMEQCPDLGQFFKRNIAKLLHG